MDRTKLPTIALVASFFAVISKSNSQFRPIPVPTLDFLTIRPLCISQFTLVNHACSMLPYSPSTTPPSSPEAVAESPCPPKSTNSHRHGHHHRHRHSSSGSSRTSMIEEECCRWLKEVDIQCVCDLLVRLPPFLAKPGHDYTVVINDDCSVTYSCPGRLIV